MQNALITYNLEEVKKTVGGFYDGKVLKDSEILNVVCQIQKDSPEDPVIKLLKETPDGGKSFRKRVDKIYYSNCFGKSRAKGENYIVQSFEIAINLLNGQMHENRDIPLSDEFFRNMREVTGKIEEKILDVI